MHLDEEQVQRLRHGELATASVLSARAHLAGCTECRERVAELDREERAVLDLLRTVDHPPPRVSAEQIAARARARGGASMRWAAGILLALGLAGVAYAAPGSPFRAWVNAALGVAGPRPEAERDALRDPPVAPLPAPSRDVAGVALTPGRALQITFTFAQAEGVARVTLTDDLDVVVRAPAGAATFTSAVDRLVVDNPGSVATFEVQIPRTARRVEIRVAGRRVLLKDGPRVTTEAPIGEGGAHLVPLSEP